MLLVLQISNLDDYFSKDNNMNILIIEDDKKIADLTKSLIKYEYSDWNIFVDLFGDLEGVNLNEIDIVLCDINLNGVDGREVLKGIKIKHPNIYAILMSGVLLSTDFNEMKKYKVDKILPKPFLKEDLIDALLNN
jgi:DNA-binding NtrC family response regulator